MVLQALEALRLFDSGGRTTWRSSPGQALTRGTTCGRGFSGASVFRPGFTISAVVEGRCAQDMVWCDRAHRALVSAKKWEVENVA